MQKFEQQFKYDPKYMSGEEVVFDDGDYALTVELPNTNRGSLIDDGMARYYLYNGYGNVVDVFDEVPIPKDTNDAEYKAAVEAVTARYQDAIKDYEETTDFRDATDGVGDYRGYGMYDDEGEEDDVKELNDDVWYNWLSSKYTDRQMSDDTDEDDQDYKEIQKANDEKLLESLCKSDTLVFHLQDRSTDMLIPIYEGRGWDVFRDTKWGADVSTEAIHELIRRHDKILCLGHGTPRGLMGGNIGREEVPLLKEKKVFALWCYAATFFKNYGFEGHGVFCSDNCPSEVWECQYACDANVSAEWILNNMYYLSDCIKDVIDITWDNPEEACRRAKEAYSKAEATTEDEKKVVEFNTNTLQVV